jgi:hypothetical protein
MTFFADLASPWNDGVEFASLRKRGVGLAALKASEGDGYVNDHYHAWSEAARQERVTTFPYHWVTNAPTKDQWAAFCKAVGSDMPALVMLVVAPHSAMPTLHHYVEVERWFEGNVAEGGGVVLFLPRGVWDGPWERSSLRTSRARYMFGSEHVRGDEPEYRKAWSHVPQGSLFSYGDRNLDGLQFTDRAAFGNCRNIGVSYTKLTDTHLRQLTALPNTEDENVLTGELREGPDAVTVISFPKGVHSFISFGCQNQEQGLPAARLRIRVHSPTSRWSQPERVSVNYLVKTTFTFSEEDIDMISVQRISSDETASTNVMVAYNVG